MKKFIISAFLVVSLFAVSVAPAFAVVGVDDAAAIATIAVAVKQEYDKFVNGLVSSSKFQSELANYKRCWGTPSATSATCTISYEALCELCISINQTNLQSCRLYYNSSLGGYVIRAQGPYFTYTSSGAYREIWDNTYSTLRNSDAQYYVAPYNTDSLLNQIENNTDGIEGYIDQIEGRLARTVGSTVYTVADSCYLLLDQFRDMIPYIDQIEGRLARSVNGVTYTVADSTYHTWQELTSMSSSVDRISGRLLKTASNGTQYTVAELGYNIWSRMNDLISAVNNQHITLDTSSIKVNVDGSNLNLWNNKSYCCGYRDDSAGSPYQTLTIPYDTATAILERLNTDYVGQSVTVLNRDGSTSTKYVRSATLLDDGAIRVYLTNGYSYYLCDNTNVLYVADMTGSLGYQIAGVESTLSNGVSSIVDAISNIPIASTPVAPSDVNALNPFVRRIYGVLYGGVDGTGSDIVAVASEQIGVSEGEPFYSWYGFDSHVDWCAIFVSWCADQCGYLDSIIPKFAVVDDGVSWFKSAGLWIAGDETPSSGDVIFFDWDGDNDPDHVGFVSSVDDGQITTIEGNMGDSPGVCGSRTIPVGSPLIYGFGTPDYPAAGTSMYAVLVSINGKLDRLNHNVTAYDDTVLVAKLTDIEDTLSKLGDNASDKITDIDIAVDRNSHDIFYVTDDDGNDISIVDLSGDSIKVVGKLMDFLYAVMFKDALDGAGDSIDGLYDFYLDNSEGVDVWAS